MVSNSNQGSINTLRAQEQDRIKLYEEIFIDDQEKIDTLQSLSANLQTAETRDVLFDIVDKLDVLHNQITVDSLDEQIAQKYNEIETMLDTRKGLLTSLKSEVTKNNLDGTIRDYVKENSGKIATMTAGAIGGIYAFRKIRSRRNKGQKDDKPKKRYGKLRSGVKSVVGHTLAAVGGALGLGALYDYFFDKNKKDDPPALDPAHQPKDGDVDNPAHSADVLDHEPILAQKANTVAEHVNTYRSPINHTMDILGVDTTTGEETEWEKSHSGASVYALNSVGNFGEIISYSTDLQMLTKASPSFLDSLFGGMELAARKPIFAMLSSLGSLIPNWEITPARLLEFKKRSEDKSYEIKLDTMEQKYLHDMFRKLYKSQQYLVQVHAQLPYNIIKYHLNQCTDESHSDTYSSLSDDQKEAYIQEHRDTLYNTFSVEKSVQDIQSKQLITKDGNDVYTYLEKYDALSITMEETIVDMVEHRNTQLETDVYTIEIAKAKINDSEKLDNESLLAICDRMIEDMGITSDTLWSKYFPFLSRLLPYSNAKVSEEKLRNDMIQATGLSDQTKLFTQAAESFRKSIQDGSISKDELQDMQNMRTAQVGFLNQLDVFTTINQERHEDENGGFFHTMYADISRPVWKDAASQKIKTIYNSYTDTVKNLGKTAYAAVTLDIGGTAQGIGATAVSGTGLYISTLFLQKPIRGIASVPGAIVSRITGSTVVGSAISRVAQFPLDIMHLPLKGLDVATGRRISSQLANIPLINRYQIFAHPTYGPEKLMRYMMRGKMNVSQVEKLLRNPPWLSFSKKLNLSGGYSLENFLELMFKTQNNNLVLDPNKLKIIADHIRQGYHQSPMRSKVLTKHTKGTTKAGQAINYITSPLDVSKYYFKYDVDQLGEFSKVIDKISSLKSAAPDSYQILHNMMLHHKDIDQAGEIVKNRDIIFKSMRAQKLGHSVPASQFLSLRKGSPQELGKMIAKIGSKSELEQVVQFLSDVQKSPQVTNQAGLVRNAFGKRENIKKLQAQKKPIAEIIQTLDLNKAPLRMRMQEKGAELFTKGYQAMRTSLRGMVTDLGKVLQNPKLTAPTRAKVSAQLTELKQFVSTFGMDEARYLMHLRQVPTIGNASIFQTITKLFSTSDEFRTTVRSAKDIHALKAAFTTHNIPLDNISDDVLRYLANTHDKKGFLQYAALGSDASKFQKILKHPGMRVLGRTVGKVLFLVEIGMIGLEQSRLATDQQIAREMENELQVDVIGSEKRNKLIAGTAAVTATGVGLATAYLTSMGVIGTIPVAGRITAGVGMTAYGVYEGVGAHATMLKRYTQNQKQLDQLEPIHLKQMYTEFYLSGFKDENKQNFYERFTEIVSSKQTKEMLKSQAATLPELVVKAMLYRDELNYYPAAAGIDTISELIKKKVNGNEKEKKEAEEEMALIEDHYGLLTKSIEERADWIQKTYGGFDKLLTKEVTQQGMSMQTLENILRRSKHYPKSNTSIDTKSPSYQALLTKCKDNPYQAALGLQYSYEYSEHEGIVDNVTQYREYMSHILAHHSEISLPNVAPITLENRDEISIVVFFSSGDRSKELFTPSTIGNQEMLDNYGISGNIMQDVLYEYAYFMGYKGSNILKNSDGGPSLTQFYSGDTIRVAGKDIHRGFYLGIYYDENKKKFLGNLDIGVDQDICSIESLNDMGSINNLKKWLNRYGTRIIDTTSNKGQEELSKEVKNKLLVIIDSYEATRKNPPTQIVTLDNRIHARKAGINLDSNV